MNKKKKETIRIKIRVDKSLGDTIIPENLILSTCRLLEAEDEVLGDVNKLKQKLLPKSNNIVVRKFDIKNSCLEAIDNIDKYYLKEKNIKLNRTDVVRFALYIGKNKLILY